MLPLALKHYDEAGRIRPNGLFWLLCLFPCRALLVLLVSLTFIQDQSAILSLVYPNQSLFYWSLLPLCPALTVVAMASYREKLWRTTRHRSFALLKPLLLLAYILDFGLLFMAAHIGHWMFQWPIALGVLGNVILFTLLLRNHHLCLLVKDWQAP